jgi:hypothetical protein
MRRLAIVGGVVLVAGVPAAVFAASGGLEGALDRQAAKWTTTPTTTSSRAWRNVPRLAITRCTVNQVTATVSLTLRGGPAAFRVVTDGVPEAPMAPGPARFVPDGTESFSYSFVGRTAPFEADDDHRFNLQWRSPTGAEVTLRRGALNLQYERGTQGCS